MKSELELIVHGIGAAPGIAIGPAYVIDQTGMPVPEYAVTAAQVEKELKRFRLALAKTQRQLAQLKQKAQSLPSGAAEDVALLLDAYQGMLAGSRLVRGVEETIEASRINAEAAIQRQITAIKASFAKMDDAYIAARAADVGEVGSRLIRNLLQQHYNPFVETPAGSVIVAEEITPADTALMKPERVAGFATVLGGAEGHSAIMARALGLPAVAGAAGLVQGITAGDIVIIDGDKGDVIVRPKEQTLQHYRQELARQLRETKKLKSLKNVPAVTSDEVSITLHANLELPRDAKAAMQAGASGIGLLRTEFMFM
ncbi:MAG TPA: phosphoenolpyruvate-utilizing N-terminal domain-containing protein, partial [Rhizomicrobium sp.]